jgi:hypothetical protein
LNHFYFFGGHIEFVEISNSYLGAGSFPCFQKNSGQSLVQMQKANARDHWPFFCTELKPVGYILGPWEMGKKLKYVEIIVRDSDGFKKISR